MVAANLERGERDPIAQARSLVTLDVDLLALTEHSPRTRRALAEAGVGEVFPHLADDADDGFFGSLVASRRPIEHIDRRDLGGRRGQVVTIDVDGVAVRVVPVHTQAPIHDHDVPTWHATITANAGVAGEVTGPTVLAGDWNATAGHRHLRRSLADRGLVDAAAALGRRSPRTWPVGMRFLGVAVPALLALDHVVVTDDVAVETLDVVSLPGSDHLGLRAGLRLAGSAARAATAGGGPPSGGAGEECPGDQVDAEGGEDR